MDEPKPCRFCGKAPVVKSKIVDVQWGGPPVWALICLDHKWNNTGWRRTKEGAIARWNQWQEEKDQ